MKLTDKAIKAFKPLPRPYKKSDGKGLFLLIHSNGSKYWRFKYLINGHEKILSLGVYPEMSLDEARDKVYQERKLLSENKDPIQEKKLAKLKAIIRTANNFEAVALEWHDNQKERWTKRHCDYVLARLKADIFPHLGFRPISEITAPEMLLVLRQIEKRGAVDIARRALQTSGQIFRYAIATGRAERDISRDLKGALKTRKKTHYNYLSEDELPEFLLALENYDGELQTKLGLKLLILTFVRTVELRGAKWSEFDFKAKLWKIPAERMKMRQQHVVPLTRQAINILQELQVDNLSPYVFPNRNNLNAFISENTLLYAIYRLGYHSRATAHGFRATASTILNENGFRPDVIEKQLAHGEKNAVRASYNHAQYIPERRMMMEWWDRYINDYQNRLEVQKNKIAA